MKFNWGTGIFTVIVIFLLAVVAFYFYITNMDINLVEDNYYEKELAYQERIDKINNTSGLPGKIEIMQERNILAIQFPKADPSVIHEGNVLFYRPSDPLKDFSVPLQLDDSLRQAFDITNIAKGRWIIKIDWKMADKEFYFEESLNITP